MKKIIIYLFKGVLVLTGLIFLAGGGICAAAMLPALFHARNGIDWSTGLLILAMSIVAAGSGFALLWAIFKRKPSEPGDPNPELEKGNPWRASKANAPLDKQ